MEIIARIHTAFPTKFGVPRQSGLAQDLVAHIIFEPPFRNPDCVRGLSDFSHIWLLWQFSLANREGWSATVRPPRLGGNARLGVFATRSPFRPNSIGLSSVELLSIQYDEKLGPVLHVRGADLVDQTPIYDIKPYLPFTDSHPDAKFGFADAAQTHHLEVIFPENLLALIPEPHRAALKDILAQDPRPAYQQDPNRTYGLPFYNQDIKFQVDGEILTVVNITPYP